MPLSVLPVPCPGSEALLYPAQISPFPCRSLPSCSLAQSHSPSQPWAASASDLGGVWPVGGFTKVAATGTAVLERAPLCEELDEGREGRTGATGKGSLEMEGRRVTEPCRKAVAEEERGWRGLNRAGAVVSVPALPCGLCLPGYENPCCVMLDSRESIRPCLWACVSALTKRL